MAAIFFKERKEKRKKRRSRKMRSNKQKAIIKKKTRGFRKGKKKKKSENELNWMKLINYPRGSIHGFFGPLQVHITSFHWH